MKLNIEFTYDNFKIDALVDGEFEPKSRNTPEYFDFDVFKCEIVDLTGENRELDDYEYARMESILSSEVYNKLSKK